MDELLGVAGGCWGLLGLLLIVIVDHSRKFPTTSTTVSYTCLVFILDILFFPHHHFTLRFVKIFGPG